MKKQIVINIALLLLPSVVMAGFFGPENYEECLLKKMKGQDRSMGYVARKVCEKKFPYEKALEYYNDKIEISWYSNGDSLNLKIINNYGDYKITRYKARFSIKSCEDVKSSSDYTLEKTFKFKEGEQSASIFLENSNQYQCMKTEKIWGEIK